MNRNIIIHSFIFFVIILFFYILNYLLKKKNNNKTLENFGIYCGYYNTDPETAQKYCTADSECMWNIFKDPNTGKLNQWCSQNPTGVTDTNSSVTYKQNFNDDLSDLIS
jgi:hypothetical protein